MFGTDIREPLHAGRQVTPPPFIFRPPQRTDAPLAPDLISLQVGSGSDQTVERR
jgi:hypothetical protein